MTVREKQIQAVVANEQAWRKKAEANRLLVAERDSELARLRARYDRLRRVAEAAAWCDLPSDVRDALRACLEEKP